MKTKKLKRDKISKITSRIALVVMCFMLIVPLGVSAASAPEYTVNITNPQNLPQDIQFDPSTINFGTNVVGQFKNVSRIDTSNIKYGVIAIGVDENLVSEDLLITYAGPAELSGSAREYLTSLEPSRLKVFQFEVTNSTGYMFSNGYFNYFNVGQCNILICDDQTFYPVDYDPLNITLSLVKSNTIDIYEDYYVSLIYVVPADPTPTTPIPDVWTGITNWITSSLASVQGVFFTGSTGTPVSTILDMNDSIVYDGTTFYKASSSDVHQFYFNGILVEFGNDNIITSGNLTIVYSDGIPLFVVNTDAEVYYVANNSALTLTPSSPPHLTFLGTITIIGVSIACAFLIIGIIQRFLKLRG